VARTPALLREPPGETFSDVWYRVAETRPRLSAHARFVRQRQGRIVSYVVEDPAAGHYYRLSEPARFFVGMLDGRRTADDAWRACLAQLGDEAPTQRECLELLAQLQLFGLLSGDEPIAPDMLAERQQRFRRQRVNARTGHWLYFNIPLMNPEPVLHTLRGPLRLAWGWPGLLLLSAVGLWALAEVLTSLDRLEGAFNNILDPANVALIGVSFLAIRLIHEIGHATACKAMGGRCTEIGVMLIAFVLPLPYCDASSSWRFPETWRRVMVALGGVLIELLIASVAAIVWARAEPGTLRAVAFNVMLISGVTTLLFNLNPLLRYDGYYVLSDLTGIPNLASRARELWKHLIVGRAFGVLGSRPPAVSGSSEAWFLLLYHALAVPYRLLIVASILLIVLGQYLSIGLVLAAVFGVIWLVVPVVSAAWYLISNPQLVGRRARALGVTAAVLLPAAALAGFVPLPAHATAPATIETAGLEPLRAGTDGYLREILVAPGDRAEAGAAVFVLSNPTLEADLVSARARVRGAEAALDAATTQAPSRRRIAETELERARSGATDLAREVEGLRIAAPVGGTVAAPRGAQLDLGNAIGRFVRRGEILAYVMPTDRPVVVAALSDDLASRVVPGLSPGRTHASVRLRGSAGTATRSVVTRIWPAGTRELPSAAFAASTGGGVLQDPYNPRRALHPLTQVELTPEPGARLAHGRRGLVRFELPRQPLLPRVISHVSGLIEARSDR
jgi:putative peptide zinc metalloprotease protein